MFGCVYFSKDRSLVVVSKISKDLKLKENEFAPKFKVSMDFKKDGIYQGIIVKTHGKFKMEIKLVCWDVRHLYLCL